MKHKEMVGRLRQAIGSIQSHSPPGSSLCSWAEEQIEAVIAALEAEPMSGPFPLTDEGIRQAIEATDRCPCCGHLVAVVGEGETQHYEPVEPEPLVEVPGHIKFEATTMILVVRAHEWPYEEQKALMVYGAGYYSRPVRVVIYGVEPCP